MATTTKIFTDEQGNKHKLELSLYIPPVSNEVYFNICHTICPKGKRKYDNVPSGTTIPKEWLDDVKAQMMSELNDAFQTQIVDRYSK